MGFALFIVLDGGQGVENLRIAIKISQAEESPRCQIDGIVNAGFEVVLQLFERPGIPLGKAFPQTLLDLNIQIFLSLLWLPVLPCGRGQ